MIENLINKWCSHKKLRWLIKGKPLKKSLKILNFEKYKYQLWVLITINNIFSMEKIRSERFIAHLYIKNIGVEYFNTQRNICV